MLTAAQIEARRKAAEKIILSRGYELMPQTGQFTGPRAEQLEQEYQALVGYPYSRRTWYDANIWDTHKTSVVNRYTGHKG